MTGYWVKRSWSEAVQSSGSMPDCQSLDPGLKGIGRRLFSGSMLDCQSLDLGLKEARGRLFSLVVAYCTVNHWILC